MKKKILENPFFASFIVPFAIVLVAAVVIYGITAILSADKDYQDLLSDLESQSFTNKGAAAYELSKLIASASLKPEERQEVAQRLNDIYQAGVDSKTRSFVIAAMGALQDPLVADTLMQAARTEDRDIRFQALVALANLPVGGVEDLSSLLPLLASAQQSDDPLMIQAAMLTFAQHRYPPAEELILVFLSSSSQMLRFTAAQALLNFKNPLALPVLQSILVASYPEDSAQLGGFAQVSPSQLANFKLEILRGLKRNQWAVLAETLAKVAQEDSNEQVALKAQELLNLLKY